MKWYRLISKWILRKKAKYPICLFIIFSLLNSVKAQENYSVKHWGAEDQLSQESINGILKDQKGFLWIQAVGGLFRFDGNHFKLNF